MRSVHTTKMVALETAYNHTYKYVYYLQSRYFHRRLYLSEYEYNINTTGVRVVEEIGLDIRRRGVLSINNTLSLITRVITRCVPVRV